MATRDHQNNRQKVTRPISEYYLHPRKGYKRKRPHERLQNKVANEKIRWFAKKSA